jgi:hypothetical protein
VDPNPIRYETIAANVAAIDVQGSLVQVSWKCPLSGRVVGQSSAGMSADPSVASRVSSSVKRSIASEILFGAARVLSSLVGGAAGRVLSNAVYTAAGEINTRVTSGVDYTEASRQAAILAAFGAVRGSFAWDEKRGQFVAANAAP